MRADVLTRLVAGHVCLHACMAGTRMAAPLLALRQGFSPLAVGILLAMFSLTQVFLALPAGRFADRHGLRRPVGWAVVASAIAGPSATNNRFNNINTVGYNRLLNVTGYNRLHFMKLR